MPTYATPGVYFERVDNATQTVQPLRTDIAGFVGIAQKGPVPTAISRTPRKHFSTMGARAFTSYESRPQKQARQQTAPSRSMG